MRIVEQSDVHIKGRIVVAGNFVSNQRVNFRLKQGFQRAFATDREQAEQAYRNASWKTEFSGSSLPIPVDVQAENRVPSQPCESGAAASAVAFFADTETVNGTETNRIKDGLEFTDVTATLVVKNPTLGMMYAIAWMPPARTARNEKGDS